MSYRMLFCLFKWEGMSLDDEYPGYTLIYGHTFPNDEPPYIMVTYYGKGKCLSSCYEDGEHVFYYYIRSDQADRFIKLKNEYQDEYCGTYIEGILTKNAGEHDLSPREYCAEADWFRPPKVKTFNQQPTALCKN